MSSRWRSASRCHTWGSVGVLINPVFLRDGEPIWTGLFFGLLAGTRLLWVHGHCRVEVSKGPRPARGRGDTPRWWLMAGSAACCMQYMRHCPLFPVQSQSEELPATTEGEWRRRHSSQGRTSDCILNSRHHVLLQGGFSRCSLMRPAPGSRTQVFCPSVLCGPPSGRPSRGLAGINSGFDRPLLSCAVWAPRGRPSPELAGTNPKTGQVLYFLTGVCVLGPRSFSSSSLHARVTVATGMLFFTEVLISST